jgi:hypothetical protein
MCNPVAKKVIACNFHHPDEKKAFADSEGPPTAV